mmetsp:Transcript_35834/g.107837  ORF Transcript_35834/g.107837 Transcript_35834/m.107837 type:complete len:340 (-) Transcript_35834:52-1071(-)
MARLFTREDPKRMHATTGALALLSFFYRLVLFARHGTSFPTWEPLPLALATVAIHGMLHVTSFIPHVSKARVMGKPMIWPEFRLHSAVFGLRHVFATALWLAARRYDLPAFTTAAVAAALVHGASIAAAWVTDKYGSREKRTTNSMAYPPSADDDGIRKTKAFYARSQFAATSMVCSGSPTLAFWPLLAIELAAFMMTMVRKGKTTPLGYHRVYTAALWWPYVVVSAVGAARFGLASVAEPELYAFAVIPAVLVARVIAYARRGLRWPKHAVLAILTVGTAAANFVVPADTTTPRADCLIFALGAVGCLSLPLYDVAWMRRPQAPPTKISPNKYVHVGG